MTKIEEMKEMKEMQQQITDHIMEKLEACEWRYNDRRDSWGFEECFEVPREIAQKLCSWAEVAMDSLAEMLQERTEDYQIDVYVDLTSDDSITLTLQAREKKYGTPLFHDMEGTLALCFGTRPKGK